ncbi:hypothetical protein A2943_00170 [Candidatus Adlerbacteria bacterium RIFCSPLOWO2_01_FULL_51_16]|uniref:NAD-dependent epimerase/dehydratase domain-containing protein n=1 Tax=Candidatus Adlerbacteria bacterium RIFCSPLOWO2_01_FULL_51_16 TaxID=1797243 RepID=A0A1F4XF30_9BACT|nr:MAG: hypothetical protein A2943_00170 [Candidatus Adlerbacteria bacterium RIFCSPLOWO2_01_FULL_51_16]
MKVVVTGGAGFIGSHLVKALLERGDEVHAVDNLAGGKRADRLHKGAVYHDTDIRDTGALDTIFSGAQLVFHTAALPRVQYSIEHPEETNDVNIGGTLRVLIAARDAGVKRVIYSGSSSAYGDQEVMPLSEDMPARPKSPYGLQKHVGELYCRVFSEVYGLQTVSLRFFNVYGPAADPNGAYALVVSKFIKQALEGKPLTITGDGEQTRDFTHVSDVVRANLLAAESPLVGKGEVLNIGAGRPVSINTLAQLIGGKTVHIEARLEPRHTAADITRAQTLLGWKPEISIETGIAELKTLAKL